MRKHFMDVARQVQASYNFTSAERLADFIVSNMRLTFGRWWEKCGNKPAILRDLATLVDERSL